MYRRDFVKMSIASTATLPSLLRSTAIAATDPTIALSSAATDESYWLKVRQDFPIAAGEILYMNNGTMGPSPRSVTERVTSRIEHVDRTGDYGGNYEEIRKAIAKVLNASPTGDEIAFTHNVSEAISIVASGLELKAGDEVILTDQEHAGNAVPWLARMKRDGIVVKFVTLVPDDDELMQRFADALTSRTRAIAVPHVTCTTGQVLPIGRITKLAHAKNIWVMADGAHPPGMMQVDVKALGVDAYASCGHKWLCGPKGMGFLYITDELRPHVHPTWTGAEADKHWDYTPALEFLPSASRYDFATQNFALFDGLHAAIDYMSAIGFDKIESRVQHLSTMLRSGLIELGAGRFHFLTPKTSLTGLTTIKVVNMDYHEFANKLMAEHKIRTRVVAESGLDANRLSVHIYTSEADIGRFLDGVRAVL
jgi:selenocysteine lyase/cysteine desulfurase